MSEFDKREYFVYFWFFLDNMKEKIMYWGPWLNTDTLIIRGDRGKSSRSSVVLVCKTIFYFNLKVVAATITKDIFSAFIVP